MHVIRTAATADGRPMTEIAFTKVYPGDLVLGGVIEGTHRLQECQCRDHSWCGSRWEQGAYLRPTF